MHLPEKPLRAYLDVFVSPTERERILDVIAEYALAHGVEDEPALFRIAHRQLHRDRRRTTAVEASVLAEEAGLAPAEIAVVLELDPAEVTAALDPVAPEPAHGAVERGTTAPPRRRRWLLTVLVLVAVAAAVWLAVVVFSGAGRAALSRQGVEPRVALAVAIGFVVGGAVLIAVARGRER